MVKLDGMVYTFAESEQVDRAIADTMIVREQAQKRLDKLDRLLAKMHAAAVEVAAREAAGKARRPARKG